MKGCDYCSKSETCSRCDVVSYKLRNGACCHTKSYNFCKTCNRTSAECSECSSSFYNLKNHKLPDNTTIKYCSNEKEDDNRDLYIYIFLAVFFGGGCLLFLLMSSVTGFLAKKGKGKGKNKDMSKEDKKAASTPYHNPNTNSNAK